MIPNIGFSDEFTLVLDSTTTGTLLMSKVIIKIELQLYPSSTPAELYADLYYRECFPMNFFGPDIVLDEVTVGDAAFEVDVTFS